MSRSPASLLQLAVGWCVTCNGRGYYGATRPRLCECIYRVIFRTCYVQFRRCRQSAPSTQPLPLERRSTPTGNRHATWVRRNEDYCADFELAARLALSPNLYRLFRWHYLHRATVRLLSRRLGWDRGLVARALRDIQTSVGRQIAWASPYSIYPPTAYLQTRPPQAA